MKVWRPFIYAMIGFKLGVRDAVELSDGGSHGLVDVHVVGERVGLITSSTPRAAFP